MKPIAPGRTVAHDGAGGLELDADFLLHILPEYVALTLVAVVVGLVVSGVLPVADTLTGKLLSGVEALVLGLLVKKSWQPLIRALVKFAEFVRGIPARLKRRQEERMPSYEEFPIVGLAKKLRCDTQSCASRTLHMTVTSAELLFKPPRRRRKVGDDLAQVLVDWAKGSKNPTCSLRLIVSVEQDEHCSQIAAWVKEKLAPVCGQGWPDTEVTVVRDLEFVPLSVVCVDPPSKAYLVITYRLPGRASLDRWHVQSVAHSVAPSHWNDYLTRTNKTLERIRGSSKGKDRVFDLIKDGQVSAEALTNLCSIVVV